MKKTNLFLNTFLGGLLKVFAFFKGQRIIKKCKIKGPAIVLGNHTSWYDFIYTLSAIYPRRVTFLAAKKFFHEGSTRIFMKIARAIPKSLMQADPGATVKVFRILKKNGIVGIFPEGQISPSGRTLPLNFAIAKLIKKAKVDVYVVKHYGAGLANPPWSKLSFRGRIETSKELIIRKEDLETMTLQQIFDQVTEKLYYSPSDNLEKKYKYKLKDIKNLENVLYQCPNCLYEGLEGNKHHLSCPKCNFTLTYDKYGMLNGKPIDEHFINQENNVRKLIDDNPHYELSGTCRLWSFRNDVLVEVGQGVLTIKDFKYIYKGTVDGSLKELNFDAKNVSSLPSDIGRNVQIYEGDIIYQFELDISWLPFKMLHMGEYLYYLSNQKINQ